MKRIISLILAFIMIFTTNLSYIFAEGHIDPDEEAARADYNWLVDEIIHYGIYFDDIRSKVNLPTEGDNGSSISWASSDDRWIDTDGNVSQPPFSFAMGAAPVTLTATITKGKIEHQKTFYLEVYPQYPMDEDRVGFAKQILTDEYILQGNSADNVKTNLNLPTESGYIYWRDIQMGGCTISWNSSNPELIATNGTVTRPSKDDAGVLVTLTAGISYYDVYDEKSFNFMVMPVQEFPLSVSYDNFSNTSRLQFNGISGVDYTTNRKGNTTQSLLFESGEGATGGSVFTKKKIRLGEDLSFSTRFSFRNFSQNENDNGNGGFAFTLQSSDNTLYGQNMNDKSIKPSVSISFVTNHYKQGSGQAVYSYLGFTPRVFYNGDFENGTNGWLISGNLANDTPNYYDAWIEYDGTTKVMEVWCVDSDERPSNNYMHLRAENIDLSEIFTSEGDNLEDVRQVYVGFMGSMGNVGDRSEIYNWYFKNDSTPIDQVPYDFYDVSDVTLYATPSEEALHSTVTASVSGTDGPVSGIPVEFFTDFGSLAQPVVFTDGLGKATTTLIAEHMGAGYVKAVVPGGAMDEIEVQLAATDEDRVNFDCDWLRNGGGYILLLNENKDLENVVTTLGLSSTGPNGSSINWISNNDHINMTNGTVILPSPEEGDQQAILTATLTKGSITETEIFNVTIKVPDESIVLVDSQLLAEQLLNGNMDVDNITGNLSMPETGQYGSLISWISDKEDIIALNGNVVGPSFTKGDQVVTVTATISKNLAKTTEIFTLTVKALDPTDLEIIDLDCLWLTEEMILNGNSSAGNITGDLDLIKTGDNDSTISWKSSDINYISNDGIVTQPTFTQGKKKVILTATFSKGEKEAYKTFELTVQTLGITNAESVVMDKKWLNISRTLGDNITEFSIKSNLNLSDINPPNESSISWLSNMPETISDNGIVVRPSYKDGHKTVTLTSTLKKGSEEESKIFTYTVLAWPDVTAPIITAMRTYANGIFLEEYQAPLDGLVLPWNVDEIKIVFDEELYYQVGNTPYFGINGPEVPGFSAYSWDNSINFRLRDYLKPASSYELVIPANYLGDSYGNKPVEAVKVPITIEEKPVRVIEVISSIPEDKSKDIPLSTSQISFKFNRSDIVMGRSFGNIILRDKAGKVVSLSRMLTDEMVTLTLLDGKLKDGTVYEIIIPAGVVRDRFNNESSAKIIQFRTFTSKSIPIVTNVYPIDGQTNVDIHQNIEITYLDKFDFFGEMGRLQLHDGQGNRSFPYMNYSNTLKNGFIITPYQPLRANTVYTLSALYDSEGDQSELDFNLSFTTGDNKLGIQKFSPAYDAIDVPINGNVEFNFTTPITRGPAYSDIRFLNSQGEPVAFLGAESGSKGMLTPNVDLNPSEIYTIHIPVGAYRGDEGILNDSIRFRFTTAKKLELTSDQLDSFPKGIAGKSLQFNTSKIEKALKSSKHEMISYTWDFGDGTVTEGKDVTHIFSNEGNYTVKLKVKDNKGFTYEFEGGATIVPLKDVKISVITNGRNDLYLAKGYPVPTRNFSVRLECEDVFLRGETIGVNLYKNGVLLKTYENITASNGKDEYVFTFLPESSFIGNYEIVFTYMQKNGPISVRRPLIITNHTKGTSFLRFQLYDMRKGMIYHNADYLNVLVDGNKKVAVREWVKSLNEYVYTVQEEFLIQRYYKFKVEGFNVYNGGSIYNVGNLGDFTTRPPIYSGYSEERFMGAIPCSLDVYYNIYVEGVDVGNVDYDFKGEWRGLDPGYYELKTDKSGLHYTSITGKFKLNPGRDFKVGDSIMARMVSKNGVISDWTYMETRVLPRPTILGKKVDVRLANGSSLVDGNYELSCAAPFNGIMGGSIDVLESIPFLDGGNIGIGNDMPAFIGVIHDKGKYLSMDFSGAAGYGETKTTKTPVKKNNSTLKKVKSVGYDVSVAVEGNLYFVYNSKSQEWDMKYIIIDMDGYGGMSWSTGYKIAGVVGVTGELKMGVYLGGTLMVDRQDNSPREYSGIIRMRPTVTGTITGSYGLGDVVGSLTGYIPAEVHIPTGYIEVEIGADVKITASFLTYKTTLYSKKLFNAHWDNGKEKLRLKGFMELPSKEDFETEYSGLELLERNYLARESVWLGKQEGESFIRKADMTFSSKGTSLMGFGETGMEGSNLEIEDLLKNIYPEAEVQLVKSGNEQWMVWTDDNPDRDAANRTQIRYSVLKDGEWKEPQWIDEEDASSDFSPTLVSMGNGTLIAWQNISREVSEEEGLSGLINNSEIAVTENVYSSDGSIPHIRNLTNDDKLDHSPKLAADGNNAILIWTKSEGLGFTLGEAMEGLKAPKNSDSLYFSLWNEGSWSDPAEIQGSLATVLDSNITMHGDKSLLLYTLDMDSDMSTSEDREVFARVYDGNKWDEPIQISDNQLSDISPKAVYLNGDWFITWVQDGNIIYKSGLNGEIKAEGFLQNIESDYKLVAFEGTNPQAALVYNNSGGNSGKGLSVSFYDINKRLWSDEIPMVESEGYVKSFSPVFTEDGKLKLAYTQAEIVMEVVPKVIDGVDVLIEQSNITNKVDLNTLTYNQMHDLAFDEDEGLQLSTDIPLPGTMATVFGTIWNQGDFAEDAIVDLYDGNPISGGILVASKTIEQPIAARSFTNVEIQWLVPSVVKDEYDLYAVVRIQGGVPDKDESNNKVNLLISTSDISVMELEHKNIAKDDYLVNAVIVNNGSRNLENIEVQLKHIQSGYILKTVFIKDLGAGQEFPVNFLVSAYGLGKDENGEINIGLEAILPGGVRDNSPEDNIIEFTLEPTFIMVEGSAPGMNDGQVAVDTVITLDFNMDIKRGAKFDQIILEDENLNTIEGIKILEGVTLTVIPLNPLENNIQYTLSIPVGAFEDDFGHTMAEPYSMSFTTTATSPEIIFAYPGEGMKETELDAGIQLRFNQNVVEGPTFTNITLIRADAVEIPILASIEGEWLNIQPVGNLKNNTIYSLVAPRGTVINDKEEPQQEDYLLTFTTVSSNDIPKDLGNNADDDKDSILDKYNTTIAIGGKSETIPISIKGDVAEIKLEDIAERIFVGDENFVMNIFAIPGVNAYNLQIPAALLGNIDKKASLSFNTSVGNIIIRSDMLSGMLDLEGKIAGITIGVGDKTKLPNDIRGAIGNHPMIQLTFTLDGKQIDWNNSATPVMVSIPYTPTTKELANSESIVIWYIDGGGNAVSIPNGIYDISTGMVTFTTTHFSYYAVAYNKVNFKDIGAKAWYNKAVNFIAARGITKGTGNGNFSPEAKLTRGQFITLLMRTYGIEPDINLKDNFSDAGNTYYTGYIAVAKQRGITNGIGNNLFAPEKEITRQEMFTILYNILKSISCLPIGDSEKRLSDFTDVGNINPWAKDAMTFMVETGIIQGSGGMLNPRNTTTRAEMAQVLYNLFWKDK